MTTTAPTAWQQAADALVQDLRGKGAVRTDAVARALREVPRHLFVSGHYGPGGFTAVDPEQPTPETLAIVYSDRGLTTHVPDDTSGTSSSTSQPSIVAKMLEAADLHPGMDVLEIGAGTGWNSALIAHITGGPVTAVEHSEPVATEARAALERAAVPGVRVHTGDGYLGYPSNGYFDRIIVTCGIAGIPPAWLDQLTPNGMILAPLAHGGVHPLTRVYAPGPGGTPTGRLVTMADFMTAAGPLYGGRPVPPSSRGSYLPVPAGRVAGPFPGGLDRDAFADLCMFLAGHDPRVTCAASEDGTYGGCAVVTEDETAGVFVQPDGLYSAGSDAETAALVRTTADRAAAWDVSGRPPLIAWSCSMQLAGPSSDPLLVPGRWHIAE
ncbi:MULTISPECIES: protein-L-isoaspartate O-methyltransferase [Kitasatospora]|uniref:Protein-L-isoaspartate O-methyltransferase n=1 Tax=Kitasatospora setae (strain ATCC 33774 / DSM 43861 / JCM 3304 / KCC A-0304 / NBRC 14216 / KM-6054) TaxID=452652 RepID=E4NG55_KITSK|nr:protein-L-isoaspartate O-methyltransferase [Kitasatospora setae]BAJ30485.1 putative protein-L-isoaspartate O-methyltransferase [Kitasatospora setae KM-6054]